MDINTTAPRFSIFIAIMLSILVLAAFAIPFLPDAESSNLPDDLDELLVNPAVPLESFELVDQETKPFNLDRLKGVWTLMFFGYTHCPDVCPTTLTELDNAASRLNKLQTGPNKIQYVFVSIDPKRDTPKLLGDYVSYFDAKFVAITGDYSQLKKLADPLGVRFKVGIGFNNEYLVNHSSAMLLIDPQARYYARLKAPHYAEEIVASYKKLIRNYNPNLQNL